MSLVTSHSVLATSPLLPCTPSVHLSAHRGKRRAQEAAGPPRCRCLRASPLSTEIVQMLMPQPFGMDARIVREKRRSLWCLTGFCCRHARSQTAAATPEPPTTLPHGSSGGHSSHSRRAGHQLPGRGRDVSHSTWAVTPGRRVRHQSLHGPQIPPSLSTRWGSGHGDRGSS